MEERLCPPERKRKACPLCIQGSETCQARGDCGGGRNGEALQGLAGLPGNRGYELSECFLNFEALEMVCKGWGIYVFIFEAFCSFPVFFKAVCDPPSLPKDRYNVIRLKLAIYLALPASSWARGTPQLSGWLGLMWPSSAAP